MDSVLGHHCSIAECCSTNRLTETLDFSTVFAAGGEEIGEQCDDGSGVSWRHEYMDAIAGRTHQASTSE